MKEIFNKIKGREWDWFDTQDKIKHKILFNKLEILSKWGTDSKKYFLYSLADLLANSSWAKAVWGNIKVEYSKCEFGEEHRVVAKSGYRFHSWEAFEILQQQGEEACITYIKSTML